MENEEKNTLSVPFVKPVRIGNFKLWRGHYTMKAGGEKTDVECIHVSNLDGSWMVRIPATMPLYATICNGYDTTDDKLRENFLGMIFTNIYNVGTTASEALHDGFFLLTEMMSFPYLLLPEKEMQKRMDKTMKDLGYDKSRRKEHIGKLCEYRRQLYELIERKKDRLIEEYERQQAQMREYGRASEEEDLRCDEVADEALSVVTGDDAENRRVQ